MKKAEVLVFTMALVSLISACAPVPQCQDNTQKCAPVDPCNPCPPNPCQDQNQGQYYGSKKC